MRLRSSLHTIAAAVRANLLPGLLLQGLMAAFLFAYFTHEGTRRVLAVVAVVKQQAGYSFAFISYVVADAVLPEILRIAFFQSGRPSLLNLRRFLLGAPAWGLMGVVVDVFYRSQSGWFGDESTWTSVVPKVLVDQFLFSPFFGNPVMIGYFTLCGAGFGREGWRRIFRRGFYGEKVMPVQVAGWLIWLPGVSLVYSMPPLLQIPVAVIISCFWILIFTTLGERLDGKTSG